MKYLSPESQWQYEVGQELVIWFRYGDLSYKLGTITKVTKTTLTVDVPRKNIDKPITYVFNRSNLKERGASRTWRDSVKIATVNSPYRLMTKAEMEERNNRQILRNKANDLVYRLSRMSEDDWQVLDLSQLEQIAGIVDLANETVSE